MDRTRLVEDTARLDAPHSGSEGRDPGTGKLAGRWLHCRNETSIGMGNGNADPAVFIADIHLEAGAPLDPHFWLVYGQVQADTDQSWKTVGSARGDD